VVTASQLRVAEDVVDGGGVVEGDTINATGTVFMHQVPVFVVMVALWVPAISPVVLTATVSVLLVVIGVVAGDTVSQEALSDVVKVVCQVVGLETAIVWFGGFVAPCTA